jgi:serine O-acetyltransferase
LIWKHSIDISRGSAIDLGLNLPHPINIVIGSGAVIGKNVTIYQGVTLGQKNGKYPIIENNVIIYPNSIIVGKIRIGENSVIGALRFIDKEVNPGEVLREK